MNNYEYYYQDLDGTRKTLTSDLPNASWAIIYTDTNGLRVVHNTYSQSSEGIRKYLENVAKQASDFANSDAIVVHLTLINAGPALYAVTFPHHLPIIVVSATSEVEAENKARNEARNNPGRLRLLQSRMNPQIINLNALVELNGCAIIGGH